MKKKVTFITCLSFIFFVGFAVAAATQPPAEGGILPDISLTVPQDPSHKEYLGLKDAGQFKIPEIRSEVVIIQIFSMYCPHCQREAPTINKIYQRIEGDPNLKNRVKIIGIGAGNSAFEVNYFKNIYNVPFPLFPDSDFKIHKQLGEVRTPYFIGVRLGSGGRHKVFYSQLGGPRDAGVMLDDLIRKSGLSK